MEKKKILVFLRTSTDGQDLQDQKNEMRDYVKSMGYDEGDCVYLENTGASAIKLDDKYLNMIDILKDYIKQGTIGCVAVWHINRLGRDDVLLIELKNLFIKHKIQFICKNPSLVLLNEDGSVNEGTELAFGLFATMVKQDMAEKKAKFKRAKSAMAKQGKWVGGRTKKFGYKVDENKFFIEDENDGAIVKLAFQLYSTGEYSSARLAKELTDRGYIRNDGLPINEPFIVRLLASESYTGAPDEKNNMRIYPPLISKELFLKCREVASGNKLEIRGGDRIVLGAKILKCPVCGSTYTSNSRHFLCTAGPHKDCDKLSIRQVVVDEICWRVAFSLHLDYLIDLNEESVERYTEEIKVLEQKISTYTIKINEGDTKKQRIIDTYLEGFIDKKTRDLRLEKVNVDTLSYQREINSLQEQIGAIEGLIGNIDKDLKELDLLNALDMVEEAEKDRKAKYDIIHKHILKITPERIQFGKKDRRVTRDNAVLFTVYTVNGKILKFIFVPKKYEKHNLYVWNGNEWVADDVDLYDNIYVKKEAN